ncbi:hypothetical protein D3C80_1576940 [compost metagenome]
MVKLFFPPINEVEPVPFVLPVISVEEGTLVQVNRVGIFEVNTISVELLWQMVLLATGSITGFGVTITVKVKGTPIHVAVDGVMV